MSNMNDIQLRRLDLGLLLVFEAVMQTGKLTRAAERLGLTQSAISHALTRLRDIFEDPLFVRRQQGVEPTPRARLLEPVIGKALALLRSALEQGRIFDPSKVERVIQIVALDAVISTIGPQLLECLASKAPGLRLAFRSMGRLESIAALRSGDADLAVGVYARGLEGTTQTVLSTEHFVVVGRRGNPLLRDGLSLERWLELDHLVVSAAGDLVGAVDEALARRGLRRRVVAAIPQFSAAMTMAARSDTVVTVPAYMARAYADILQIEQHPPPIDMAPFDISVVRLARSVPDPVLDWLEAQLQTLQGINLASSGHSASATAPAAHPPRDWPGTTAV